jgi:group II intron reverse transcriptase/maturase
MKLAKPFEISKRSVWTAYKLVRANRGGAGIDEETLAKFEVNLANNLYRIWNRMSSGSYFPPPVKQVEIPKKQGGVRTLGVPTVSDRIAQMVVKLHIEPSLEMVFDEDSYGYRPGKSAKQAIAKTRRRCWQNDWVVEFDIKGAFDNIDHDLLMRAVRKHVKLKWALLYIERWLKAPSQTVSGETKSRAVGTPQGGVISPLLMNVFMHYAFDTWMRRNHPVCPFARYADDAVVHCRTHKEATRLLEKIAERLETCRLQMHPDKSKIVYCKDSNRISNPEAAIQFTFLGFAFRPRQAISKQGVRFTSFLPAASPVAIKGMRSVIRSWNLQKQTPATIEELSQLYNPILTGWWNYYGSFYPTEMRKVYELVDLKLARWARRKYKPLARHKRRSVYWLGRLAQRNPKLFIHWSKLGKPAAG